MDAHPEAAERAADEAVAEAEPAPSPVHHRAGPSGSSLPADPPEAEAAAARWLDLWERALGEIARRGP